jgi:hypothetical protein
MLEKQYFEAFPQIVPIDTVDEGLMFHIKSKIKFPEGESEVIFALKLIDLTDAVCESQYFVDALRIHAQTIIEVLDENDPLG